MLLARKVMLISAAFVHGGALAASAADIGDGSLDHAPVLDPMPTPSAGWYIRMDGGHAWFANPSLSIGSTEANKSNQNHTWTVGGGFGRYFAYGFRGDVTLDYLIDESTQGQYGSAYSMFDMSSTVLLANLYYEFNRSGGVQPYIGAGIGWAHNETSGGFNSNCACAPFGGRATDNFAAAAMGGVSWRLKGGRMSYIGAKDEPVTVDTGPAIYLDIGYRFLYLGEAKTTVPIDADGASAIEKSKDIMAHQIRLGLRYDWN